MIDPCPFCDSLRVDVGRDDDFAFVFCGDCDARGPKIKERKLFYGLKPVSDTSAKSGAIDKWNAAQIKRIAN